MEKRAMAFILCLSIIVTMFIPVAPVKALEDSAFVMYEDEVIENIYITETEKRTVSAVFDGEALSYQWQILVSSENDVWANIYDKTTEECEISYALVNNMLERTGEAYIRCKITYAEGEAFTNGVSVSVYEDELAENEPEMVEPTILVSDMQVVEPEEETAEEEQEESSEEELPIEGEVSEEEAAEEVSEEETMEESSEEEIIEEEPTEDVSEEEFSEESAAEEEILEEAVVFEASYEEEIELLGAEPGTGTEPEKEYVTITIYYLDAASLIEGREESAVYTPYVATIEKGSAFSQNVISPTYLGFAPYLSTDDNKITVTIDGENYVYSGGEDASTVVLDYAEGALIKDEEIKVYYKPIEVPYGVRYFFQNINDDSYTEEAILYHTHTAVTGTIINDSQFKAGVVKDGKDYSVGFTQMYHIPEAVASDGSTVFEVYYDRNYYLIEFDFNGGYGSDPIYARYGTPFVVNDPVRHGYVFDGWDLIDPETGIGDGIADEMPKTIQAGDQKYKAKWTTADTTYTVAYWIKDDKLTTGTTDDTYEFIGNSVISAKSGTTVSGENNLENAYLCGEEGHAHTADCKKILTCKIPEHSHVETCYKIYDDYICGKEEHTHNDSCKEITSLTETDLKYLEYVSAETKIVEGDGSTVVNVYYQYKQYNLRFYYAMSRVENGKEQHYVVGGSTWFFGSLENNNTADDLTLLNKKYKPGTAGMTGAVDELPTLNARGTARNYGKGYIEDNGNKYYYIDFNARYNSDISNLWPCDVFNSVTRIGKVNDNGWAGEEAFVSAWNGEHHVWYSQNVGNQTVKGNYTKLDYKLLFDLSQFSDSNEVSYLCFWENGANEVYWNTPKLFRYNIYYSTYPGQDLTGKTTDTYNGKTYYLAESYDTCDNSNAGEQTEVAIPGYMLKGKNNGNLAPGEYDSNLYLEGHYLNYYYEAEINELAFYNHSEFIDGKGGEVAYSVPLQSYFNFPPEYPKKLEPNAYYFDGWYTTADCFEESKVSGEVVKDANGNVTGYNVGDLKMPAGNLTLYAKWSPNVHTVQFFHDLEDLEKYEKFMEENKDNPSPGEPPTKPIEGQIYEVEHGNTVGSVPNPERDTEDEEELAFGGWFYLENGEKKAFTPTDFPIKRDMNIFADWAGETPVPYKISYVERGTGTKVADDYTGFAKVGSTKTFNAKAGYPYNQLYPEFNGSADSEGYFYFPVNASHSITMEYDDEKIAANAKVNKYTFEYVKAGIPINYKVRYVDKETGEVLGEELKNTKKAVVTERFKAFPNYVPDAFYKRLVISVKVEGDVVSGNDEENIVIFYYSKNETSAYYAVHYMLEKLDATDETRQQYKIDGTGGYEETGTHIEGIGDIDSIVKISPQKFTGFTLLEDKAKEVISTPKTGSSGYDVTEYQADYSDGEYSITITENGTELYIFYSRNEYPYDVYHYKYNSTEPVDPDSPKDERQFAKYGSEVTVEARDIPSWTCVNGEVYVDPETNEIILVDPNTGKTIDGEEIPSDAIKKNMLTKDIHEEPKDTNGDYPYTLKYNNIIFYYVQTEYVIEYVAVPPEGGTLSLSLETVKGNDTPVGSTPAANENYEFKGWYLDEACTKPVTDEYGTVDENNKLVPKTTLLHPNKADDRRNIFYAKFDPLAGDFTIVRDNTTDEPGDREQVFVYEVRCTDEGKDDLVITVTITGNGTVTIHDLPLGTYTVTQKNNWSWRYTDEPQTKVQHNSATGIAVEFNKEETNVYWLNGNSKKEINEKA